MTMKHNIRRRRIQAQIYSFCRECLQVIADRSLSHETTSQMCIWWRVSQSGNKIVGWFLHRFYPYSACEYAAYYRVSHSHVLFNQSRACKSLKIAYQPICILQLFCCIHIKLPNTYLVRATQICIYQNQSIASWYPYLSIIFQIGSSNLIVQKVVTKSNYERPVKKQE